jgi:hypothetical protein
MLNLFGQPSCYDKSITALTQIFNTVVWLPKGAHPADGVNIIVIGFKQEPVIDFDEMRTRAEQIEAQFNLPAKTWVDGLKAGWLNSELISDCREKNFT